MAILTVNENDENLWANDKGSDELRGDGRDSYLSANGNGTLYGGAGNDTFDLSPVLNQHALSTWLTGNVSGQYMWSAYWYIANHTEPSSPHWRLLHRRLILPPLERRIR